MLKKSKRALQSPQWQYLKSCHTSDMTKKTGEKKMFLRDYCNKILQGDCLEVLKTFPSESFDCVMTSPPYWALRKYFSGVSFKKCITEEQKKEIIEKLNERGIKPKNI
jgi:DNA modification methylase